MELSSEQIEILALKGNLADLQRESEQLFQQLEKVRKAVDPIDASVLRSILNGWRGCGDLTLCAPEGIANQLLAVLDALAIAHGTEEETRKMDAMFEKVFDASPRRL